MAVFHDYSALSTVVPPRNANLFVHKSGNSCLNRGHIEIKKQLSPFICTMKGCNSHYILRSIKYVTKINLKCILNLPTYNKT